MGSSQQFSLRWNNYLKHITCAFDTLRTDEDLVDVTLSCEGKKIRAHKMLLSACSTYFRDLFKENPCQHPIIIFRNVKYDDLAALVDFMYQGEVNVVQEQLGSFLSTAGLLAVQGLTDGTGKDNDLVEEEIEIPNEPEVQLQNASSKAERDNKRIKSPSSPLPYHATELPEAPQPKRRKTRESANMNAEKNLAGNNGSTKDVDGKNQTESQTGQVTDPIEIIPLMPNLKLEMPEYLEQDGSSCSYEDQGLGDATISKLSMEDTPSHDEKIDISQTFYSNQSTSDGLDGKHQSADVGHMHSKPGTSGERPSQEAIQDVVHDDTRKQQDSNMSTDFSFNSSRDAVHSDIRKQQDSNAFTTYSSSDGDKKSNTDNVTIKSESLQQVTDTLIPVADFKQYLNEIKVDILENIKQEITNAKNSILYFIRKGQSDILCRGRVNAVTDDSLLDLKRKLDLSKPFNTYEEFVAFDSLLVNDNDLRDDMNNYIHLLTRGSKDIADAIKRTLPEIISNPVQLMYSGCGRKKREQKKESFKDTNTYTIIKGVVQQLFPNASSQDILSKTSRWFSGAPDRDGGRKERMTRRE